MAILVLNATPGQIALLRAADLVPGFLIGLVAGVWVDRLRRRPVMIAADLGRALLLGSIPLVAFTGHVRIEQLYIVALLASMLTVFSIQLQKRRLNACALPLLHFQVLCACRWLAACAGSAKQ